MPRWPCQITTQCSPDQLRQHGPMVPAWWAHPDSVDLAVKTDGHLLLDTGAFGMMIDEAIAAQLKLPVQGEEQVHGAHGYGVLRRYLAKLILPVVDSSGKAIALGIPVECFGMPQLSERHQEKGLAVTGVLGRLFLQFCSLEIDGLSGRILVRIDESVRLPRA